MLSAVFDRKVNVEDDVSSSFLAIDSTSICEDYDTGEKNLTRRRHFEV
jgi:hypothetical protein